MPYILPYTQDISCLYIQKISTQNRSFKYGDGLFESMAMFAQKIPLLANHYKRLLRGMRVLKMEIPTYLTLDFLQQYLAKIAEKEQLRNAFIRVMVYRDSEGKYTPKSNTVKILVEIKEIENQRFELNKQGLLVDVFTEIPKPINILSSVKTNNCLLYILAGIFAKENKVDDCLLINTHNHIIESSSANLFLIKDKQCITPPLSDGCLAGVMRQQVIKIVKKLNMEFVEKSLTVHDLLTSEEVFLTNAVKGIQWVRQFRDKSYSLQITKTIAKALQNKTCKEQT